MPIATVPIAERSDFRTLALQVRSAGLLERRLGYYGPKIVLTLAAFAAAWVGFFVVGPSWVTLGIAALLGVISTQLGFLGHDAGHRQVFASPRANRLLGLLVGNGMIGLSFGWWVGKHSAHHAHPNEVGRDPDIGVGLAGAPVVAPETGTYRGFAGWLTRWQAQLFFPLMLLRSTGLYVSGVQDLLRRRDSAVGTERRLFVLHVGLYLGAVFWVLPPLMAIAFLAVHQAVFSVYLGCSFAPNHKGMPILDGGSGTSFAERQVITARNISGSRFTNFVFGGLNYQIEHHLFPAMPRPNLARAQILVRTFCVENGFAYCEEGVIGSFRQAIRHLRAQAILSPA